MAAASTIPSASSLCTFCFGGILPPSASASTPDKVAELMKRADLWFNGNLESPSTCFVCKTIIQDPDSLGWSALLHAIQCSSQGAVYQDRIILYLSELERAIVPLTECLFLEKALYASSQSLESHLICFMRDLIKNRKNSEAEYLKLLYMFSQKNVGEEKIAKQIQLIATPFLSSICGRELALLSAVLAPNDRTCFVAQLFAGQSISDETFTTLLSAAMCRETPDLFLESLKHQEISPEWLLPIIFCALKLRFEHPDRSISILDTVFQGNHVFDRKEAVCVSNLFLLCSDDLLVRRVAELLKDRGEKKKPSDPLMLMYAIASDVDPSTIEPLLDQTLSDHDRGLAILVALLRHSRAMAYVSALNKGVIPVEFLGQAIVYAARELSCYFVIPMLLNRPEIGDKPNPSHIISAMFNLLFRRKEEPVEESILFLRQLLGLSIEGLSIYSLPDLVNALKTQIAAGKPMK